MLGCSSGATTVNRVNDARFSTVPNGSSGFMTQPWQTGPNGAVGQTPVGSFGAGSITIDPTFQTAGGFTPPIGQIGAGLMNVPFSTLTGAPAFTGVGFGFPFGGFPGAGLFPTSSASPTMTGLPWLGFGAGAPVANPTLGQTEALGVHALPGFAPTSQIN